MTYPFWGIEDRVLSFTFSEFGRRIKSNFSIGTDHGAAAPVLVFGSKVQSGVLGENPHIPVSDSANVSVPRNMTTGVYTLLFWKNGFAQIIPLCKPYC